MFKKAHNKHLSQDKTRFLALMCGAMALLIGAAVFMGGGAQSFSGITTIISPTSQTASWLSCTLWADCSDFNYPSCYLYANGADSDVYIYAGQGVTLNWGSTPPFTQCPLGEDGNPLPGCTSRYTISNYGEVPKNGAATVYPSQTTFYQYGSWQYSPYAMMSTGQEYDECTFYEGYQHAYPSHFRRTIHVIAPPTPSLAISVSPNPIGYQGSTGVYGSATGGAGYDACYLGGGNWGGGVGVGTSGSSGSGGLGGSTTFWYQCHDTYYGWIAPVYATVTMNPPAGPTMNLSVSPNPVNYGTGTGVYWSATGGAGYDACYLGGGQWGGGVGVGASGSSGTIGLTTNTQYWFQCHDTYYGWITPAYATVSVNPPPAPTQTISASPTSITAGQGTTVSWSAGGGGGYDACYLGSTTGPWVGGVGVGTGGTSGTGPLYSNTSFAFQCHDVYYGWLTAVWASVAVNNVACPNGSGYSGSCTACNSGYVLQGGSCVLQCTNGSGPTGACTACNNGYVLSGGQCILQCPNGSGPTGACTACNAGYVLSGGNCALQCPNGSGPAGACTACNSGYTLVSGSCVIPSIGTFSATPSRVRKSTATNVTFSYTVTNPSGSCTISGPAGFTPITFTPTNGVPGTRQGSVTIAQATNFRLTCGSVSAQSTLNIVPQTREL